MEMVCIVCPNGCRLSVERTGDKVTVSGNKCKRGEAFAVNELTNPTRSVTTSVKTTVKGYPVISVKTDGEIPKGKIFELMNLCKQIIVTEQLPIGATVATDLFGTGVNLITTKTMEETNE